MMSATIGSLVLSWRRCELGGLRSLVVNVVVRGFRRGTRRRSAVPYVVCPLPKRRRLEATFVITLLTMSALANFGGTNPISIRYYPRPD
jgi:hypothetical protein